MNSSQKGSNAQHQDWQKFVAQLKKQKSTVYSLLQESYIGGLDKESIKLIFPDEKKQKLAKSQVQKIKNALQFPFQRNRVHCEVYNSEQVIVENLAIVESPLQTLNLEPLAADDVPQMALTKATDADKTCETLYQHLTKKTRSLADITLTAQFSWRVRVGGMRGFRDLLLPVLHPVYGVPYLPSSSLKGAVRAWAKRDPSLVTEINRLLGTLDNGIGCVQILDAFPTRPCLSLDMANPQWSWDRDRVKYQPVPHALLSMEQPEFAIGLIRTSRGVSEDVQKVEGWLKQALAAGIGSRVSAGYGRTTLQPGLPHSSSHQFQMWTQGIYGASPHNPEFRPVAVRGMLRYWFRAIALGIYDVDTCKQMETQLFGTLSQEGSIRIGVEWKPEKSDRAYVYEGKILLEAKHKPDLILIEKVLQLASHLGGVGRGARRPLHWNSGRMRGCHWEVNLRLPYDQKAWQECLEMRDTFLAVRRVKGSPGSGDPGQPNNRYQDVLNRNARIYLVPCPSMKHPNDVRNWSQEGNKSPVTGKALDLLYGSNDFKGVNRQAPGKPGNPKVGGDLGTPSFMMIKSNFPNSGQPYQTVTIFGAEQSDRAAFAKVISPGAIQVWPPI